MLMEQLTLFINVSSFSGLEGTPYWRNPYRLIKMQEKTALALQTKEIIKTSELKK